jgi:hypothetical protein
MKRSNYELSSMTPEQWQKDNAPKGLTLVYAFEMENEIMYNSRTEREEFERMCVAYGFAPDEYKNVFMGSTHEKLMLVGFIPGNHKYKCRLKRMSDGKYLKATAESVRKFMDLYLVSTGSDSQ